MILNETIYSHCNSQTIYGYAGEEITIISERGNVMIVEGLNGRFPVTKSKISNGNGEDLQGKEFGGCTADSDGLSYRTRNQAKPLVKNSKSNQAKKAVKVVQPGTSLFG